MPERAVKDVFPGPQARGVCARASGKAILMGEHSVVYGHPALALALGDVGLRVELGDVATSWEDGLTLRMRGDIAPLPREQRARIAEGFEMALKVTGVLASHQDLDALCPRALHIDTAIPLGAGMGGSAAMSTAFVRLGLALGQADTSHWTREKIAAAANEVDGLFHGKASGLDAAAVSSDGIIRFCHGAPLALVTPGAPFHLVLVDSGERSSTADMVSLVARRKASHANETDAALSTLGRLTNEAHRALEEGRLVDLGMCLDSAHEVLRALGVSTPRMDALCEAMRAQGALGAKLTGAGGGGLVLGLFADDPRKGTPTAAEFWASSTLPADLREHGEMFITSIGR